MTNPTNYRLALAQTAAGLEATWILPDTTGARFPLAPGLTAADLAEHRWYLEEYLIFPGPGDHARARVFEQRLDRFGEDLYRALFDKGVDVLRDLVTGPEPRLLTLCSEEPDALALPWELLRDALGPLISRDVVIRRQLVSSVSTVRGPVPGLPLRVLLVIARPTDVRALDARSSAAPMLDALDALGGLVRVDLCDPPTLAELERRLDEAKDRGERYHVVHFDGHGDYDRGVGALYFEKPDATRDLVPGRALGDLLTRVDVPLVLLAACRTADLSGAPVFGSVAPALLRSGVGSVIAFSHAVFDAAARILVERFYRGLCAGKSVGGALNAGRRALQARPIRDTTRGGDDVTLRDWHIAQLYQAGLDPVLVHASAIVVAEGTDPLQRGLPPSKEFGPAPMYGFHGRGRELLALQRKLRKHHAVVVQGMGGMGKTSLGREAAHWWHQVGLRPGGAAFFSFETRQGTERVVQAFVQYVEGERFAQGSPEALWARAVTYFRTRDVLWVWDNFESTLPQFREGRDAGMVLFEDEERDRLRKLFGELMTGKPRGWLVVTCRPDETGLPGIAEMALEELEKGDALAIAREILARKDLKVGAEGYERDKIEALLEVVGWHPLSIELVMAHLRKVRPAEAARDLRKLVAEGSQEAEGKNRSLLASLKWSTDRLSEEARGVLPYLAWFQRGAFEAVIEAFCAVGPEVWGRVREELLATALVWVENGVLAAEKPYLGFHPTLPYAAAQEAVTDSAKAERRFVEIYHELAVGVRAALQGAESANGMRAMLREEGNVRRAMALALARGDFPMAVGLADSIGFYLDRAGRVRDQARLAAWVKEHMAATSGSGKWAIERDHAWGLFRTGRTQEALDLLVQQLQAIEDMGGDVREKALCLNCLGRVLYGAGQAQSALGPLAKAIEYYEAAGDRGNLAAALGDQANALRLLGRLTDALTSAERFVTISRELEHAGNEAVGIGIAAQILTDQYRFSEAEQRYEQALLAARRIGDVGLEGVTLHQLGTLSVRQGEHALAVTRYKEALARFQATEDRASEMQAAGALGAAEMLLGHHDSAQAWYACAERLARELGDERHLGVTAQNVGILLQEQALALPAECYDERRRILGAAAVSLAAALTINRKLGDEVRAALSLSWLGIIHLHLGNLDEAERHSQEALAFFEPRDLPNVWQVYANLENIAVARHSPEEAAAWRARKEAKLAQIQGLAQGDGPPRLSPAGRQRFLALCQALHAARVAHQPLPPSSAADLVDLLTQPDPLGAAGRFLQRISAGALPEPPPDLPPELSEILSALVEALRRVG